MRTMCMAQRFHYSTKRFTLLLFALVSLSLGGCARGPQASEDAATCSLAHIDILQAIHDDIEIRSYAAAHFESSHTPFLWDRMSSKMEACGVAKGGVKIVRSSSDFDRNREFIIVEKMYFDDDAAFVEVGFPPTGKNGDVFLRKRDGKWVIVDKLLWES